MRAAPPPADRRITFDTYREFPNIRWSLSHMRELAGTVNVWRGPGAPSHLEGHDRTGEIEALAFVDMNDRPRRFDEALLTHIRMGS